MLTVWLSEVSFLTEERSFQEKLSQVSAYRREKAQRYRFPKDRALSLGVGLLLDHALQTVGLREKDMVYALGGHEKPAFSHVPGLHFNLSHSGTVVMAALSDSPVGCDVEQLAPPEDALARRVLTAEEYREFAGSREECFYRYWTGKESVMKATGLGMTLSPESFTVSLTDGVIENAPLPSTYRLGEYFGLPGYAVAWCAAERDVLPRWVCLSP